jgi:hypothetical protein
MAGMDELLTVSVEHFWCGRGSPECELCLNQAAVRDQF